MSLPNPDPAAAEHSRRLREHIARNIDSAGGWISFARYMELALYAPGLGYYSGGAHKFGAAGDFVTAPELSPLYAQSLAAQAAEVMAASAPHIIEAGAGSGALAAGLLEELERRGYLPERYAILELSGELRQRQRETLAARVPQLAGRVTWLDTLPESFSGAVIGNELLDALPVHLVAWREEGVFERGAALDAANNFVWQERPASAVLRAAAQALPVGAPFVSEINLAARAWVAAWGRILAQGALLLIDYGFPQREYYHPQRAEGTLMCHYRHHAHGDPFWLPGLNDITAHVDFTSIAEAGHGAGLDLLGYTGQAQFLLNCGITELLARCPADDPARYLPLAAGVQKLISPAEMGELFKVMALGRCIGEPLLGFRRGDRSHAL
jgi:SAM-dependent MidA family methyltransferase